MLGQLVSEFGSYLVVAHNLAGGDLTILLKSYTECIIFQVLVQVLHVQVDTLVLVDALLLDLQQPIEAVVLLELDDAVLIERLLARGRADDNEAVIRNRLEVYREKTAPLISFYRDKDLLIQVPAQGSVEEISGRIVKCLS